ncbi:hypothetical protein KC19_VG191000 [Ceratodon purpureus]|uniref:Uncharacterized protein n=1 Tax=Ceratodon purpureus TaxID=3225 RepID=A0A8T0HRX5_CERPU|nr:hypothetical protein KC19_VG191000 [Ceratodon purpureus]
MPITPSVWEFNGKHAGPLFLCDGIHTSSSHVVFRAATFFGNPRCRACFLGVPAFSGVVGGSGRCDMLEIPSQICRPIWQLSYARSWDTLSYTVQMKL